MNTRYTTCKGDWFEMWIDDKRSIIACMNTNMQADLDAGYDPHGMIIIEQRAMIARYTDAFHNQLDAFKSMTESDVDHWCYYDLLERGAID